MGQFDLIKTRRADKAGKEEYDTLLADRQKRYKGDRDQAVRSANIAAGYGNSTAQRFMHEAGVDKTTTGSIPTPTPRPDPTKTSSTSTPLLEDRATRDRSLEPAPDLAVSPKYEKDRMSAPVASPLPKTAPLPVKHGGITIGPPDRPLKSKLRTRGHFNLVRK